MELGGSWLSLAHAAWECDRVPSAGTAGNAAALGLVVTQILGLLQPHTQGKQVVLEHLVADPSGEQTLVASVRFGRATREPPVGLRRVPGRAAAWPLGLAF